MLINGVRLSTLSYAELFRPNKGLGLAFLCTTWLGIYLLKLKYPTFRNMSQTTCVRLMPHACVRSLHPEMYEYVLYPFSQSNVSFYLFFRPSSAALFRHALTSFRVLSNALRVLFDLLAGRKVPEIPSSLDSHLSSVITSLLRHP